MKILVDEMHEKWVEMLKSQGFEAYSARELRETHNISSDYSILKYAQENKMFFITSDKESGAGCTEQGIPHLFLDDEMIFDLVLFKALTFQHLHPFFVHFVHKYFHIKCSVLFIISVIVAANHFWHDTRC